MEAKDTEVGRDEEKMCTQYSYTYLGTKEMYKSFIQMWVLKFINVGLFKVSLKTFASKHMAFLSSTQMF